MVHGRELHEAPKFGSVTRCHRFILTLTLVNPLECNSWKLSHNQMLEEVDIVVIFIF